MNEDLRGAIEVAKSIQKSYETVTFKALNPTSDKTADEYLKTAAAVLRSSVGSSLQLLITTAEQVLEAGEELPEKTRNREDWRNCPEHLRYLDGLDEAIDLCLPILARYKIKIAELEEALSAYKEGKQ